jgi:hypothetical protein
MVTIKKVKASTLVEVLVASVIILVIFFIAATVFVQSSPAKGLQKLKAIQALEQYVYETKMLQLVENEEKFADGFFLKREVIERLRERIVIDFFVYDGNRELRAFQKRILLTP